MKRREFISFIGGAAAAWPVAARAQQAEQMPHIAVLMNNAEDDPEGQARAEAFRQGLQALGWIEGKNLRIDRYWTAGDLVRIRGDAKELAGHPPDIIVANGRGQWNIGEFSSTVWKANESDLNKEKERE